MWIWTGYGVELRLIEVYLVQGGFTVKRATLLVSLSHSHQSSTTMKLCLTIHSTVNTIWQIVSGNENIIGGGVHSCSENNLL